MEWVTRVQKFLLVLLVFSQLDFVIGTFIPPSPEEHAKGFVGWDAKVASTNLWSDYRPDAEGAGTPTFFKVIYLHVFIPVQNFASGVCSVFSCSNWNCGRGKSVRVKVESDTFYSGVRL